MSSNLRKIVSVVIGIIALLVVIVLLLNLFSGSAPFKPTQKAVLGKQTFKIKVAQTDQEKQIGLSQTKDLPNDYGMLFTFSSPGYYPFWMKEMKYPIDIIYIKDNKVVKLYKNVPAPKDSKPLPIYVPEVPADKVFEINAGLAEKYKIKEGDTIILKKI